MFVDAIEKNQPFTCSIHFISRNYGEDTIQPGAATFFVVNSDGWALTCRHVAQMITSRSRVLEKRREFEEKASKLPSKNKKRFLQKLVQEYGFKDAPFELLVSIPDIEGSPKIEIVMHNEKEVDVALMHFLDLEGLKHGSFPVFAKNGSELKPGKFLCRLGFPFVEFSNYTYDKVTDKINWTTEGKQRTPVFPTEGMVTRHLSSNGGKIIGFEMSTPGLRGQSGGPVFDTEGRIWGIQSQTVHLDLDFDINVKVVRNGKSKRVQNNPFLHVGHCIHIDILKDFMRKHKVQFSES